MTSLRLSLAAAVFLSALPSSAATFEEQAERSVAGLASSGRAGAGPGKDAAIVQTLESLRGEIEDTLRARAMIIPREQNLKIEGRVLGTLNGTSREYSPLSMLVVGTIFGGLLGGGLGAAASLPFLAADFAGAGAVAGAAAGGAAGPFVPTGSGQLSGQLSGELKGEGYYIHDKAELFGLVVLDRAVLGSLEQSMAANPGIDFSGCPQSLANVLRRTAEQRVQGKRVTLNETEAEILFGRIQEYQAQLRLLRQAWASAASDPARSRRLQPYVADYESWAASKRLSVLRLGAVKPVIDVNRKTVVHMRVDRMDFSLEQLISYGVTSVVQILNNGSLAGWDAYWQKSPGYTKEQMAKDFDPRWGPELVTMAEGRVIIHDPNSGRYAEGPIEDRGQQVAALRCGGKDEKAALEFLYNISTSHDFYLDYAEDLSFRSK